jgi:Acetyltransferase (GNAT) domain
VEPRVTPAAAPAIVGTPGSPRVATDAPLTVEPRLDLELSTEDVAALDAMIENRPATGVFISRAWLSGYFADPPEGFHPWLIAFREGPTLRGVVPIAVRGHVSHIQIRLLGGTDGSDRVDLLACPGFETRCADAFVAWLRRFNAPRYPGAVVFELRDVPDDSPLWGAFRRGSAEGSLRAALIPREIHTLPYLDLVPRSGSTRHSSAWPSVEKHRRWLERRGALRIETLVEPVEVMKAFETLTRFLHARWRGHAAESVLDDERKLRFHRLAVPLLLQEGRLRLIRISSDIRTVAVFYGLASGGWWGYYLAGFDREWAGRIHLGRITLAAAIQAAVQEGARQFDFLKGTERVKYLWPVHERTTLDADLYSDGFGSQARRAARATREAAAAFGKAARHLVTPHAHGKDSAVR